MRTNNATTCIALCIRNESCLLTLMTEESCFHCNYGKVDWIRRYDSNQYIGLKITVGLATLVKNVIPVELLPQIGLPTINADYTNETCSIGKFELKKCEEGWEMFRRGNLWYCLQVLYNKTHMPQAVGKQKCRDVSAKISGLESLNETRFVAENVENEMSAKTKPGKADRNGWAVWIDGERKYGCTLEKVINITADCQGVKGFDFRDKTLNSFGGYDWSENEPNGYKNNQSCVVMMLHTNGTKDKRHRKLDDTSCIDTASFLKRGVLCGMLAK